MIEETNVHEVVSQSEGCQVLLTKSVCHREQERATKKEE